MSLHLTTTLSANQRLEFFCPGDFFRLMQATQPLLIQFYSNGAEVAEADQVLAGYAERFRNGQFDRIAITNGATPQTIQIAARNGNDVQYDTPPNGNVTITNTGGSFNHATHFVDTISSTIRNANAARRYLLIQNKNATVDIYVMVNGGTASTSMGILIQAGGSYELTNYCPTGAITAITASGSNSNVITVEG